MEDLAGPQVMERWIGPAEGWLILCRHSVKLKFLKVFESVAAVD
jgi:hypothetical protein